MWSRWVRIRRESFVRAWSGLTVPAAVRVISERELSGLIDAAERDLLGWDAGNVSRCDQDIYLLLPYSYEEQPVPLWKCRVLAFANGLAEAVGGKRISLARLDVPLDVFERLPVASRKVERQLLHWLAWKVAAAEWKKGGGGSAGA